jgi:hypothetical protein
MKYILNNKTLLHYSISCIAEEGIEKTYFVIFELKEKRVKRMKKKRVKIRKTKKMKMMMKMKKNNSRVVFSTSCSPL